MSKKPTNKDCRDDDEDRDHDGRGHDKGRVLLGTARGEEIVGTRGDDHLFGRGGNDFLTGGRGDDKLDGGKGFDTALFSGAFADYDVNIKAHGKEAPKITVVDLRDGGDGTDRLHNVELLQFSDGKMGLDGVFHLSNTAPVTTPVALAAMAEDSGERVITQAALLANASDAEGNGLTALNLVNVSGNGTLLDNGDGTWIYTPALNDDSSVSFAYDVTDGALSAAGTATLDITPVNDAPVAQDGAVTAVPGVFVAGTLSATDVDGDSLSYALQTGPANGTLSVLSDGGFSYAPNAGFVGSDSFEFLVSDGQGGQDVGTIAVTVLLEDIVGTNGNDALTGGPLDDRIFGLGGDDFLTGAAGDDLLDGGSGFDNLFGALGADTFVLSSPDASDRILDFSVAQGDKIDISDLLDGYDAETELLQDFVQVTPQPFPSPGTQISVNASGEAGGEFVPVGFLAFALLSFDQLEPSLIVS